MWRPNIWHVHLDYPCPVPEYQIFQLVTCASKAWALGATTSTPRMSSLVMTHTSFKDGSPLRLNSTVGAVGELWSASAEPLSTFQRRLCFFIFHKSCWKKVAASKKQTELQRINRSYQHFYKSVGDCSPLVSTVVSHDQPFQTLFPTSLSTITNNTNIKQHMNHAKPPFLLHYNPSLMDLFNVINHDWSLLPLISLLCCSGANQPSSQTTIHTFYHRSLTIVDKMIRYWPSSRFSIIMVNHSSLFWNHSPL